MNKRSLFAVFAAATLAANAQKENVPVATGQFSPEWESLNAWECPGWFKDAKFGIWAHWGPQCQAEDGDWYGRFMYYDGTSQNTWHFDHFGDPAEFGLKDLCNAWKAENWDPESLINLYKSVGARYFMALGNHHDNFDNWNSPYQEWNSVNVGPKKDLIKGWGDACKKAGLPLGVSIHASHTWTWLEPSQNYDGNLTKEDGYTLNEDGSEKWWKGMDPQELYAQQHEHSTGWESSGTIHSQWDWGNGASLPSEAYKTKFQNRVLELINDYNPDMLYFDDTAMPFYGCDDAIGQNILAHYYNHSAKQNGGTPNVVVTGKQLTDSDKKHMLWDVERGIPDRIQDEYWQTCTCIGDWHYSQSTYNNNGYKSAKQVVNMLVDIVSKNGNLLLSIPVKGDGTIDDKEVAILNEIKAWMDVNSSSIYGTRPWKTFGEGPLAEASHALSAQGFNEGNNYSSSDVAYCQRNDTLFATIMRWPSKQKFTFESLGMTSEYYPGKVKMIELIGYGPVDYSQGVNGLTVTIPSTKPNEIAPVFQMTFEENTDQVIFSDIINAYEDIIENLQTQTSYNTGKYSKKGVQAFKDAMEDAKQYINDTEANQKVVISKLQEEYELLNTTGRNQAGAPSEENARDYTTEYLVEASKFSASDIGSRFGTPENWTVENFNVPMIDPSKGTRKGIDNYPGYNCLNLGVWSGEDEEPYTCDLSNARVYRKVHLEPGRYYFGAKKESSYNLGNDAFIYAATETLTTGSIEDNAIAFANLSSSETGTFYGIYFTLKAEQDVVLCFQADLTSGSSQQEIRIGEVKLNYYGNMDFDALSELVTSGWETIDNAKINYNTGSYKKSAADTLRAAIVVAENTLDTSESEDFTEAYNTLQAAIEDFLTNGKNIGGQPLEGSYEDITIEKLKEANNFERTEETNNGARFGAPKNWVVENFGFDNEAGIDNNPGYDCLHLEVWWNNNAFAEHGYDIKNVRLYQKVELPAGRYHFGASYPTAEANDDLYIFASESLTTTDEIPTASIAYEQVKLAPADGTFRGITFTLDEDQEIYLGFQADFSAVSTANLRASGVKLLSYGNMNYVKVLELVSDIEKKCQSLTFSNNTGHYSPEAYEALKQVLDEAGKVNESTSMDDVTAQYNAVNEAYNNFLENGKVAGGQPDMINATDITESQLIEASDFSRADASVTTRFATPANWTVENFMIDNGSDGVKNGIDKYPGYECLSIGIWNDLGNNSEGDPANARIYRKVHLEPGHYYFGAGYNTTYNVSSNAYLFAADEVLSSDEIPTKSIAYYPINKASDNDGLIHGIYFTLEEEKDILLGFQMDLTSGSSCQEFRAKSVVLYSYNGATAIEEIPMVEEEDADIHIYSVTGVELNRIPDHGLYIIRQGNKSVKYLKK